MPDNVFLNMNNYFLYIYIIMLKYILPENNKRWAEKTEAKLSALSVQYR